MMRRVVVAVVAALAVGLVSMPNAFALAPAAPTVTAITPGAAPAAAGPLTVSFVPGAANGSPIISFTATCTSTNGGISGNATRTASPIVVANLTTAKTYQCSVTARNAQGVGPASTPGKGVVGAPAVPHILRVLPLKTGLALPFVAGPNNGSAITNYRGRCTSSNGGIAQSPLQLVSPMVVTNLTAGKTYSCLVNANNARGAGPTVTVGPVVINAPVLAHQASCTGTTGSVTASPGLVLAAAKPQTLALSATLASCTGPYVSAGRMAFTFRTPSEVTCQNLPSLTNNGFGTLTWSAPGGMGTAGASMHFVVTSTSGHVTKVHIAGVVTSKSNLFTGRALAGDITLDRGLHATSSGGDCTVTAPLKSFGLTKITLTVT